MVNVLKLSLSDFNYFLVKFWINQIFFPMMQRGLRKKRILRC